MAGDKTQVAIKRPVQRRVPEVSEKTRLMIRRWFNRLAAANIRLQLALKRWFSHIPEVPGNTWVTFKRLLRRLRLSLMQAQLAVRRRLNHSSDPDELVEIERMTGQQPVRQDQQELQEQEEGMAKEEDIKPR